VVGLNTQIIQFSDRAWGVFINFVANAGAGTLYVVSTSDGVTNLSAAVLALTPGSVDLAIANTFMFQDHGKCKLFYDSRTSNSIAFWQAFSATGNCPNGPFVKDNNGQPLTALQPMTGTYGVPTVLRLNGVANYWLLANVNTPYTPSDIYHLCDPLGVTGWAQVANGGQPIIVHRSPAFDQAGDPWAMDLNGVGTIFADEENNSTPYAQISVWKTTGPLASISCP